MFSRFAKTINRASILFFVCLIASVMTAGIILNWQFIREHIGVIATTVIPIVVSLSCLCVKFPKVYMYLVYIKAVFIGVDTLWNVSARLQGQINPETFSKICKGLEGISERISSVSEATGYYKASLDGINIQLGMRDVLNDDLEDIHDFEQELHFQIVDYRAPYENTLSILENSIIPYLAKIEQMIVPTKTDYELTINFYKENPWAKAVTRGVKFEDILDMNFQVKIDGAKASGSMTMRKKDIRLSCSDLGSLTRLIKRHLIISA